MTKSKVVQRESEILQDVLATGPLAPKRAKYLARQIAEELLAAQEVGVSHGGLGLAHIVLLQSSKGEQAVVTGFGGHTGVRSDIYAFGQVLEALLPGHRLASQCMAADPAERPDSFELVLEELQELQTPRTWIGTLLIAAVAVSLLLYEVALNYQGT